MNSNQINNKCKIEESNKKRLESLKEKLNEYKNKKTLIRSSLNDLDSGVKKPKKIVFDDSEEDSDDNQSGIDKIKNDKKFKRDDSEQIVKQKNQEQSTSVNNKKKFKLIGSDSESESDEDDSGKKISKENEEAIKMFESKINLDEKKANKLIYLKTKFSNEENRFKIDERFMEEEEEEDDDDVDEKDIAEKNDKLVDNNNEAKITKKQLKNENLNQLKILEEITGKQIIKPKSLQEKEISDKKLKSTKNIKNEINKTKMIRYDPTKDSHKMFEIKKDSDDDENEESSSSDDDESKDENKTNLNEENSDEETNEEKKEQTQNEDGSKFFKVESNIKDLFSSNDVFKFEFTDETEKTDDENEVDKSDSLINSKLKSSFLSKDFAFDKYKKSKYSSSESEDEDELEEHNYDDNDDEEYQHKNETINKQKESFSSNQIKYTNKINEIRSFLPQFDQDNQIKDALIYFCRPKDFDLDNLRKEWLTNREQLVKEYKKKHKKMIRIQKSKENEKLLPWMKKSNHSFNMNKNLKRKKSSLN